MIKKLPMYGLVLAVSFGCQTQKDIPAAKKEASTVSEVKKSKNGIKPYSEVITAEAKTDEGLFTTHFIGDKLFFEIPEDLLEKDMLLVSRIAEVPSGYGGG